ncbi:MAG: RNA polymerase sporulation sigma factor SigK [Oscillospiraceae bacterium]|nr:RNA polymerase sporulation sigma factor SigK [Oscillospiraceae bacterium]
MLLETIAAIIMNFTYLFLKVSSNGEFPSPLNAAKEKEHFLKYKDGDLVSRNILIERNLRLVAHIVKKYYTTYKDQDDLISIGTIGLIKAIDTYNIDNGAKFATYACTCVKNEILMYFRSIKKTQCETSIYDSIDIDKDGNPLTYIELISCEDTIADDIDTKIKSDYAKKIIETKLTKREKEIIQMRYGVDNIKPKTQKEVSNILGISRSYVSRPVYGQWKNRQKINEI